MQPLQVLVVDDEPSNVDVAEVILTSLGHKVTSASNGRQAIERCIERVREGQKPFDLILMDLHMPVMDGARAARALGELDDTRGIPIVCVTADATTEAIEQALNAGCVRVLHKPYKLKDMLAAIVSVFDPDANPQHAAPAWKVLRGGA